MKYDCTIAIVNPFASIEYLVENLKTRRVRIIAIYVEKNFKIEDKKVIDDSVFDVVFEYRNDTEKKNVINQLKKLNVDRIIYGSDFDTVEAADELAELICNEYANDKSSADKRVNKFEMNEALKKADIPCCKQILVNEPRLTEEQRKFIDGLGKVIVKPTVSSASFLVKECSSSEEVEEYIKSNYGTHKNFKGYFESDYNLHAPEFVVQEKLMGDEYVVDAVSCKGKHCITGVLRYKKEFINGAPVYRYTETVDMNLPEVVSLCNYIIKVLNATGFNNNISHNEVFLSKERGPMLVEINPRISGGHGFINMANEISYNRTQVSMLVESIINESGFVSDSVKLPQNRKPCLFLIVNAFNEKEFHGLNVDRLKGVESYKGLYSEVGYKIGEMMRFPKSLADAVGFIMLENENKEALHSDYLMVKKLEESGELFK